MVYGLNNRDFSILQGQTLKSVNVQADEIIFTTNKASYRMFHDQDCCECVSVEDIRGDLVDLLDQEIILAEVVTSEENPEGVEKEYQDSFTWTFYKLSTNRGSVTIRWYGESNGYYSEEVDFVEL